MKKISRSLILFFAALHAIFPAKGNAKTLVLPFMGRNYSLVVPKDNTQKKLPLLILLHGCKQNPEMFLEGTHMTLEAEKGHFFVLAPEQPAISNMDHCWNWFFSLQQHRFPTTEMGQILSMVDFLVRTYRISRDQIYLAGMSAGGALAHAMLACYPDYFRGVAIHSGLAFKTAETMNEAGSVLTSTQQKDAEYLGKMAYQCGKTAGESRLKKIIILQGANDPRVLPLHAELVAKTTEVMADYQDDSERNHSQKISIENKTVSYPRNYSAEIRTRKYGPIEEKLVLIHGMQHAWGGGAPISVNFDENAPSSTDLILKFFSLKK